MSSLKKRVSTNYLIRCQKRKGFETHRIHFPSIKSPLFMDKGLKILTISIKSPLFMDRLGTALA